jgi:hypothetical protein
MGELKALKVEEAKAMAGELGHELERTGMLPELGPGWEGRWEPCPAAERLAAWWAEPEGAS